jgi:orotidine-5'-phosphate decarboxylase
VVSSKILVALDYDNEFEALAFVEKVTPDMCRLKVGKELFCATGKYFVEKLVAKGFDVFLDMKFYDIPNTVASVLKVVADMGIWMVNVHTSGGERMMSAASEALSSHSKRPLLIGVTVLTSMNAEDLKAMGVLLTPQEQVIKLATLAKQSGLDGVVCSANEVELMKSNLGKAFLAVTPGIRPTGSDMNDQRRIVTPEEAIIKGSDYLVIGRPITKALKPLNELLRINNNLLKL